MPNTFLVSLEDVEGVVKRFELRFGLFFVPWVFVRVMFGCELTPAFANRAIVFHFRDAQ